MAATINFIWGVKVAEDASDYKTLDQVLRLVPRRFRRCFRGVCERKDDIDPLYELCTEFSDRFNFSCEYTDNGLYWGIHLVMEDLTDHDAVNISEVLKYITPAIEDRFNELSSEAEVKGRPSIWMVAQKHC